MNLNPQLVIDSVLSAKEIVEGMGSISKHGTTHLMRLKLPINTISSIFHVVITQQLKSKSDYRLLDDGKENLLDLQGRVIRIKTTSDGKVKANHIKDNSGYYIVVYYRVHNNTIYIESIETGNLIATDWKKNENTNFAFLKEESISKLSRVYPT